MTPHCEWCPFPGCDSCAYKGHERHLPPAPTGLTFTAYGIVAGQGSKRHVGNGVMIEQSKRVKPWRAAVRDAALTAITEWEHLGRTWVPYAGPVRITITFVTRRPQGHYRTGRFTAVLRDNAPLWHAGTPDIDKALRATFDALTEAGIWRDDKLVAQVTASKVYGVRPGARIHVEPIGGAS